MVVGGSNCAAWNDCTAIEQTLGGGVMGGDDSGNNIKEEKVGDVEEGEISDSTSVEEISEEDFVKQESKAETTKSNGGGDGGARVWTMRELYNYPGFRGYRNGLVNLAWAQAVQNKPLNELFVMDEQQRSSSSAVAVSSGNEKVVIIDSGDEMEEGELEEGEIDLDSENGKGGDMNVDREERDVVWEKRVNLLREALESLTITEAEKSFGDVCLRFLDGLGSLRGVLSQISVSTKEALVKQLFSAVVAIISVFRSMSPDRKEQNKEVLARILSSAKSDPSPFPAEQLNEIEVMSSSMDSSEVQSQTEAHSNGNGLQSINGDHNSNSATAVANASHLFTYSANKSSDTPVPVVHSNPNISSEFPRSGTSSFKGRGLMLPLLDLHMDHDEDSLPSPTREPPACFPVRKPLVVADGMAKKSGSETARVAPDVQGSKLHVYETEALKAVSSYQQKFSRNSFLTSELPSPTPSEDGDNGDDDGTGEVSSSSAASNVRTPHPPFFGRQVISSHPPTILPGSSGMQGQITAKSAASVSSGSSMPIKSSAKSRDPRLRFANSDVSASTLNQESIAVHNAPKVDSVITVSSRKHKFAEESNFDGPESKRQRGTNSVVGWGTKTSLGSLEDSSSVGPHFIDRNQTVEKKLADPRKMVNVSNSPGTVEGNSNGQNTANEQLPLMAPSSVSLPAILKDIAVNPTMLINILKLQQQRVAEAQQKAAAPAESMTYPPSSISILGAASLVSDPSKTSGALPMSTSSSQTAPMDEAGKVRMKLRDPRRLLHGNALKKGGSLGQEQFRTIVPPLPSSQTNKDDLNGQKQDSQADNKLVPSQSVAVAAPDIASQFTKNLKNIADIISVSQVSTTSPTIPSQNLSTELVPVNLDKVEQKAVEQHTGRVSAPEPTAASPSCSPATWGDVEHLFEGYDDKQKAAIQRERTRRLEEQKKMFAARKLCLVLDLDHTLLNSAKFVEVDLVHDEILKKKEEQDRKEPKRHLFRFQHMGMWTKLRPGVWNFLEKASQLFEMHLYTMGNKLYATEMAKVLDPTGALFAGRVISRGDDGDPLDGDERVPKSKDLEGVLGMESAVVIIDDSVRVWPHNKLNLIVVERYTYFPCSRRQFGLLGPSLLEIDHDERHEDGTLASSLAVIEKIHQIFFSHPSLDEADVRNILASEQQKILGGCRIVFSRMFPVGEVNPHLHPLWQTAEQFGASCTNQIDDQVTHVVANSLGTDKVNWALSSGKFVVHPGWVEASALLYRRANEQDFAIKP
ncbi:RNA polymerase II C-terminal domain phosphatase-like 3 [Argentina anserina]|uniref:RNA polymerase II C-terminal domain phosphatase-like 3 n=1 Tax=Argentina anserina TaxID=57926 RepID=UPI00217682B4|nr:RNA polymerase II C-terminal domain phosphatase-like 3 [Potentilla anserina]